MNRASRIYNIIKRFNTYKGGNNAMMAWQHALNASDVMQVYKALVLLDNELTLLIYDLEKENIPEEVYLTATQNTHRLLNNYAFNSPYTSFQSLTHGTTEKTLQSFVYMLRREEAEITLDIEEDIAKMYDAIDDIDDIQLKAFMKGIVDRLDDLDMVINISGIGGLERAFKSVYCEVNSNLDYLPKTPNDFKVGLAKIWTTVTTKIETADKAITWAERFQKVLDILDNLPG